MVPMLIYSLVPSLAIAVRKAFAHARRITKVIIQKVVVAAGMLVTETGPTSTDRSCAFQSRPRDKRWHRRKCIQWEGLLLMLLSALPLQIVQHQEHVLRILCAGRTRNPMGSIIVPSKSRQVPLEHPQQLAPPVF
jgi:Mg2+/citrate symporter